MTVLQIITTIVISLLIEYPGLTVKVENGNLLKAGDRIVTRMGDTATVISVRADTVTFDRYVVHGSAQTIK